MEWLETAINKFDLAYADSNHHLLETHNFPALSPFFFSFVNKIVTKQMSLWTDIWTPSDPDPSF